MKKLLLALVFASTVCTATNAADVVFWIGRPTTADLMTKSMTDAIVAAGEYKRNINSFETTIDKARTSYFTASMWSKGSAGEEFASLLYGKDLMLASMIIPNGFGQHSSAMNQLFGKLNNNRQVDGGIRTPALAAFQSWVMSLRQSLGARGENDVLFISPSGLQQALIANVESYEKYRRERDLAELRLWKSAHPQPDEVIGNRKLFKSGVEDVIPKDEIRGMADTAYNRVRLQAQDAGAKLITCSYGPSYERNGYEVVGTYEFWKDRAPTNIGTLLLLGQGYTRPHTEHALSSCPSSEAEITKMLKAPQKTAITAEAQEKARAERAKDQEAEAEKARQRKLVADMYRERDEKSRVERAKEMERINAENKIRIPLERKAAAEQHTKDIADRNAAALARSRWSREEKIKWNEQCQRQMNLDFASPSANTQAWARMKYSSCVMQI